MKSNKIVSAQMLRQSEDVDLLFIFVSQNYFIELYDNGYITAVDYKEIKNRLDNDSDYRNTVFHISQVCWIDDDNHLDYTSELDKMPFTDAIDIFAYKRFQHNSSSLWKNEEIDDDEIFKKEDEYYNPESELFSKTEEELLYNLAHSVLYSNSANLTPQQLEDIRYIFFCDLSKLKVANFTNRSNTTVRDSYKLAIKKILSYFYSKGV